MQKTFKTLAFALVVSLCLVAGNNAQALTFGFENISANSVADAAIGEAQLFVDVADAGSGQAQFTFRNTGPSASSITDIYIDDGGFLSSIASIDDSDPGVSFSAGASPGNLPSANSASPSFQATSSLSADSDPKVQPNGVNPGETLDIFYALLAGVSFDDVIAAILGGDLRVGIHVQGFAGGGSESFVNTPAPVPLPGGIVFLLTALGGMGLLSWRRRPRSAA